MKVNVIKRESEVILDCIREKEYDKIRYFALEYMVQKYPENLVVYINTHTGKKKSKVENIDDVLSNLGINFERESIEKIKRKIIDLSVFFIRKEKKKDMSESMYLFNITDKIDIRILFKSFLRFYDYGLGAGSNKPTQELIESLKNGANKVFFSKEYFSTSLYDSQLFNRIRMDAPFAEFLSYMEKLIGKKTKF